MQHWLMYGHAFIQNPGGSYLWASKDLCLSRLHGGSLSAAGAVLRHNLCALHRGPPHLLDSSHTLVDALGLGPLPLLRSGQQQCRCTLGASHAGGGDRS